MESVVSFIGLLFLLLIAWVIGGCKRPISWRLVISGCVLQFAVALLLLNESVRRPVFEVSGDFADLIAGCSAAGADFVFGLNGLPADASAGVTRRSLLATFAFGVLPTVIFFSSLMSVLYYIGVMQWVVRGVSRVMQKSLGTTGAETLAASANIFVGQTEAPLVVKPYIATMHRSELNAMMVGGFASVAGSLLLAYSSYGVEIGHLLIASFISAPASLVIAKLIEPMPIAALGAAEAADLAVSSTGSTAALPSAETTQPLVSPEQHQPINLIDAAATGAADGLKMALNIAAMLIAFLALIALVNAALAAVATPFGFVDGSGQTTLTLQRILGYCFAPMAFMIGIPWGESLAAGELLGLKVVANEFLAYERLGAMIHGEERLSPRTVTLMTYALCGFANLSSIGIQIGGISALAPERRSDIASLGFRAMIGGLLACNMTACVVGILPLESLS